MTNSIKPLKTVAELNAEWEQLTVENSKPRIVQILQTTNDDRWCGCLLGLGDDGVTYECKNGRWEPFIPPLSLTKEPSK